MILDHSLSTVTSYRLEPAIESARDARGYANSVILGVPPGFTELQSLVRMGMAAVSSLAFLSVDAEAEARFERLLAAKRGPAKKILLKAK